MEPYTTAAGTIRRPLIGTTRYRATARLHLMVRRAGIAIAVVTLSTCLLGSAVHAQSELRGRVLSADARQPIPGARAIIRRVEPSAVSDSTGQFRLSGLRAGVHLLRVEAQGFAPESAEVVLLPNEVLLRDFTLRPLQPIASRPAIASIPGQPRIDGVVTDSSGQAIPYASIDIGDRRVVADQAGHFALALSRPRRLSIDARRIGFRPARLELDVQRDTTLNIMLEPVATVLSGETIFAMQPRRSLEVSGFYRRLMDHEKGINAGRFLTEEDIERRKPVRITQMFEGIPSLRNIRVRSCSGDQDPRCWAPAGIGDCPMMVYLDGKRMNRLGTARNPNLQYAEGLDDIALPSHIAGIEVYTSPSRIPPEYQLLGGRCGAILIWTK